MLVIYGNQYAGAAVVVTLAPLLCMPKAFIGPVQSLLQSAERQSYVIAATVLAGVVDIGVAWYLISGTRRGRGMHRQRSGADNGCRHDVGRGHTFLRRPASLAAGFQNHLHQHPVGTDGALHRCAVARRYGRFCAGAVLR